MDTFKKRKNEPTSIMNKAIREFYMRFMVENSKDQGKLFRAAKKLTTENKLSFLDHVDKNKLTNEIAEFFVTKVDEIPRCNGNTCE